MLSLMWFYLWALDSVSLICVSIFHGFSNIRSEIVQVRKAKMRRHLSFRNSEITLLTGSEMRLLVIKEWRRKSVDMSKAATGESQGFPEPTNKDKDLREIGYISGGQPRKTLRWLDSLEGDSILRKKATLRIFKEEWSQESGSPASSLSSSSTRPWSRSM